MTAQDTSQTGDMRMHLRGRLGLASMIFIVVAGAAPLTVVGGPVPLAFAIGNGAGVPTMFIVTGVILVLFAVGFTTMSRFVRTAGAFYAYAHVGIGRRVGIGTGYVALLSYLSLYIGMFGLLGPAMATLVESFGGPQLPWWVWAGGALIAIGFIGFRNIEFSGLILGVLLVAEVAVVLVLDAAILFAGPETRTLSTGWADLETVLAGAPGVAFLFAILGFIGVEATAVFRDEARDPERNVPRATYISVIFIAAFYAVTSWLMASGVGDDRIASVAAESPDTLLPDLMQAYLGKTATDIVVVLFVTSIIACILTFHNVVSRYVFSLSDRQLLPDGLNFVHPRLGSPARASVAVSLLAGVVILLGVVLRLDAVSEFYTWLVGLASLGYVCLLVVTTVAVLRFFWRRPEKDTHVFRRLIAPLGALAGLLLALTLILINLGTLVGESFAVGATVVLSLIVAFALGPIIGKLRPAAAQDEQ